MLAYVDKYWEVNRLKAIRITNRLEINTLPPLIHVEGPNDKMKVCGVTLPSHTILGADGAHSFLRADWLTFNTETKPKILPNRSRVVFLFLPIL